MSPICAMLTTKMQYGCPADHPSPSNPSPAQATASSGPRTRRAYLFRPSPHDLNLTHMFTLFSHSARELLDALLGPDQGRVHLLVFDVRVHRHLAPDRPQRCEPHRRSSRLGWRDSVADERPVRALQRRRRAARGRVDCARGRRRRCARWCRRCCFEAVSAPSACTRLRVIY